MIASSPTSQNWGEKKIYIYIAKFGDILEE